MKTRWLAVGFVVMILGSFQGKASDLQDKFALIEEQSFQFFDLSLSPEEIDFLQKLKIGKFSNLNNFGELDILPDQIVKFLISLGNDEQYAISASLMIYSLILQWVSDMNAETCWVCLRAFQANTSYDLPRWHIDGIYYYQGTMHQYKVSCALKGAPTIICDDFHGVNRYEWMKSCRAELARLCQSSKIYSAGYGQGALFVVGDTYKGTIHSEPAMNEDRLFLSIVPGSKQEIIELAKRWKNPK